MHSSMLPDGTNGGTAGGFLLTLADGQVYFACDTALFSDMKLIGAAGLDLAVVPIGDRFTMGPDDAVEAIKLLSPKRVAAGALQHLAADRAGRRRLGRARAGRNQSRTDRARTRRHAHGLTRGSGSLDTRISSPTMRTSNASVPIRGLSHQVPSHTRKRQACQGQVTTPSST